MNPKRCLIIGATSDIAKELIYIFANYGYSLDLAARRIDELDRIASDLRIRYNIEVKNYKLDIENMINVDEFIENYKYVPDVVVFAIGYLGNQQLAEIDWNEAKRIIDINYTSQIPLLNNFANLMAKSKHGTIIGISSIAGERGRKANYFYGSAKSALTQYLSGLRQKLSDTKVRVLTVKPGFIRTKMTSHLAVPSIFEGNARDVAKKIFEAYKKNQPVLITPSIYKVLNTIIKFIPEGIFKKLNF